MDLTSKYKKLKLKSSSFSKKMEIDYRKLVREVPRKSVKVTLKKSPGKGVGLFATKEIEAGEVIAYYRIKVFRHKDYESPTNGTYLFEVYKKNGDEYKRLIGDIYEDSFPPPVDGITFWAPFANEPTVSQRTNAEIDTNIRETYQNKTCTMLDDIVDYKLVATRDIHPKDEILWYYGDRYSRNYKVGKK
jgi:hypothetical protein